MRPLQILGFGLALSIVTAFVYVFVMQYIAGVCVDTSVAQLCWVQHSCEHSCVGANTAVNTAVLGQQRSDAGFLGFRV